MPSQPLGSSAWDFGPVLDFIREDETTAGSSPPLRARTQTIAYTIDNSEIGRTTGKPTLHLGSFNKLWEKLGISIEAPPPALGPVELDTDISSSDDALSSSPADVPAVTTATTPDLQVTTLDSPICLGLPANHIATTGLVPTLNPPETPRYDLRSSKKKSVYLKDSINPEARLALNKRLPRLSDETPSASSKEHQSVDDSPFAGMSKKQRKKARQKASKGKQAVQQKQQEDSSDESGVSSKKLQAQLAEDLRTISLSRTAAARARSNVGAKISPPTPALAPIASVLASRFVEPLTTQTHPLSIEQTTWSASAPSKHVLRCTNGTNVFGGRIPSRTPTPATQSTVPLVPYTRLGQQHSIDITSQYLPQRTNYTPVAPAGFPYVFRADSNATALHHLEASFKTQDTTVGAPYTTRRPTTCTDILNVHPNVTPFLSHSSLGLVPSSVQPVVQTGRISPKKIIASQTKEDGHFEFLKKLMHSFPQEKKCLVSPMRLSSDKMTSDGIHVFVDASNILIGFQDILRRSNIARSEMSFDCLALLLERRRPVAKRVYAGSTRVSAPHLSNEKFTELAEAVGYEPNIYEQVYKPKELTPSQKFFRDVDRVGWAKAQEIAATGGSGSDSETGAVHSVATSKPTPKWVEQGVDESLHLKMCQSIIDCEMPSTMVLATGDGAGAEYSDGFLAHVERALKKGWCVELVSWRQQTSSGYKNKKFRTKWGERFKIIELDDFLAHMIDA